MKNSLKKLLGGLCALAVSASMFSGVVFADEANSAFFLPEADLAYTMINDPNIPDSELEFFASTLMAQGILGDVVYQLLSYSDANPNSAFFKTANELMDAPTSDILGVEDETNAAEEESQPEAKVISTKVTKHTYDLDKAAGIIAEDADEETYGEATSIVQKFKSGTNTISKIKWDFDLPMNDGSENTQFSISAIIEGKEDGGDGYQEFQLPNIEVNGEFTIGIVLNGWVPAGNDQNVEDTSFVNTSFEYTLPADSASDTSDETTLVEAEVSDNEPETVANTDETVEDENTEAETVEDTDTADTDTAASEPVINAADAE